MAYLTENDRLLLLKLRTTEIEAIKAEKDIDMLKAYYLTELLWGSIGYYHTWRQCADKKCKDLTNSEVECANLETLEKEILKPYN